MMNEQVLMRRYLLGELPDSDAERFEQEYFGSDTAFAEMLAAEDDLIEDFLRRRLKPADRRLFEERFLATPRGRQKVALASALERVPAETHRIAWTKPLAIAAVAMVVAIGMGMLRELVVMRQRIEQLQSERPTPRAVVAPRADEVFSIILSGGLERGSTQTKTIVLPRNAATAELWLVLPRDDFPTYTATLQSVDGRTLRTEHSLTARALDGHRTVVFRVPCEMLEPETYVLNITGDKAGVAPSEPIEDFSFTVRRP